MGETNNGGAAGDRVRHFLDRVDKLEDEKEEINTEFREDIKTIYTEAASEGFNVEALKEAQKRRRKARKKGASYVSDVDLYESCLRDFDGTPLGASAAKERQPAAPEPAREPGRSMTVARTPNRDEHPYEPPEPQIEAPRKRIAGPVH